MAFQGTHTLQAITAFNPDPKPVSIFGQLAGVEGLAVNERKHYAPDALLGNLLFANGVTALLRCGSNAPRVTNDKRINVHKRVSVYGSRGQLHWSMWHWETLIDGKLERKVSTPMTPRIVWGKLPLLKRCSTGSRLAPCTL